MYDYTDRGLETAQWYGRILDEGAQWVEPYYAQGAQALVADYGIPFRFRNGEKQGQLRGMVAMTVSLKGFTELIHSLSLGRTGFGFVASTQGALLAHPIDEYIGRKNLSDLIKEESRNQINAAYQGMLAGETGQAGFYDETKGQDTLFFYDRVPASGWGIGVTFFTEDLLGPDLAKKRKYMHLAMVASLLLLFVLACFYNRDFLSTREIWYLSLASSTVLIGNVFLVGYLQHAFADESRSQASPPITDNAALSSVVGAQARKAEQLKQEAPRVVPTGIYIERLQFDDSYNLSISGQVWQRYPKDLVEEVAVGFQFPQTAPFAEASFIEESYREEQKEHVLVHFDFRCTLRMNFEYGDYPFDKRNIDLQIRPVRPSDNLLLTPDLDGYTYTNPSQKSGLSPSVALPGSRILETFFSFSFQDYDTAFGLEGQRSLSAVPMLQFNLNVKRVLITAFVTYLIPIFVTLIMIYIMLFATYKPREGEADGGGIVQGMAAFFFVLVFSHIDLRKGIDTAELIYMEYFYFVTYIMVVLTTYNLIVYTRRAHRLFDYKHNLIVKATFWPMFWGLVLVVTWTKFY